MKSIVIGLAIVVLMLVGYIIYVHVYRDKKNHDEIAYWKDQYFKPDTVYTNNTYRETLRIQDKYPDSVPPKTLIVYRDQLPEGYLDFKEGVLSVIDSLKNTKTPINTKFITLYPNNPKFLGGSFKKDSIRLDLLNTQGVISSQYYPVDYSLYNYQYVDNSMRADKLPTRISSNSTKKPFLEYERTYLNYNRDLLQAEHQLEIESNLRIWKIRIGGYARYPLNSIQPNQKLQGGIKVGVGLF